MLLKPSVSIHDHDAKIVFYNNKKKEIYKSLEFQNIEQLLIEDNFLFENPSDFLFKYQIRDGNWKDITKYAPLYDLKGLGDYILNKSNKTEISSYDLLLAHWSNQMTPEDEKSFSNYIYHFMRSYIWANSKTSNLANAKTFIEHMKRYNIKHALLENILFYLEKYILMKEKFLKHNLNKINFKDLNSINKDENLHKVLEDVLQDSLKRPDLSAANILAGKIMSILGRRQEAAKIFSSADNREFLKLFSFDAGVNTYIAPPEKQIEIRNNDIRFITNHNPSTDTVILISLNPTFLRYYGTQILFYISSLKKYHFHFHIIGEPFEVGEVVAQTNDLMEKINNYRKSKKVNLPTFSTETIPDYVYESKTYFACARYLRAKEIMDQYNKNVFIVDADMFIESDLNNYLEQLKKHDIVLPFSNGIVNLCPWRRILAGNVFLSNNHKSRTFLEYVEEYIYHNLSKSPSWMLDQNALTYAYEIISLNKDITIGNCNEYKRPMLQKPIGRLIEKA